MQLQHALKGLCSQIHENLPFEASQVRSNYNNMIRTLEAFQEHKGDVAWDLEMAQLGMVVMKNMGISFDVEDEICIEDLIDD